MLKLLGQSWRLRRLALACFAIFVFWWMYSYCQSLKEQLENLNARLDKSLKTSDSLATQLQVINEHKEKIEEMLKAERQSHTHESDIRQELSTAKEIIVRLKQELVNCVPPSIATFYFEAQQKNETSGTLQSPVLVKNLEFPANKLEQSEKLDATVTILPTTTLSYAGKLSANFRRNKPADENLEFRRNPSDLVDVYPKLSKQQILENKRLRLERKQKKLEDKADENKSVIGAQKINENPVDYKEMPER